VGGGPAGLTAAIYRALPSQGCVLYNGKKAAHALIPESHNYPAFPHGISVPDLLRTLRPQAETYDIITMSPRITALQRGHVGFVAMFDGYQVKRGSFCWRPGSSIGRLPP
jgi:thioredoxin reductase (NADPH)